MALTLINYEINEFDEASQGISPNSKIKLAQGAYYQLILEFDISSVIGNPIQEIGFDKSLGLSQFVTPPACGTLPLMRVSNPALDTVYTLTPPTGVNAAFENNYTLDHPTTIRINSGPQTVSVETYFFMIHDRSINNSGNGLAFQGKPYETATPGNDEPLRLLNWDKLVYGAGTNELVNQQNTIYAVSTNSIDIGVHLEVKYIEPEEKPTPLAIIPVDPRVGSVLAEQTGTTSYNPNTQQWVMIDNGGAFDWTTYDGGYMTNASGCSTSPGSSAPSTLTRVFIFPYGVESYALDEGDAIVGYGNGDHWEMRGFQYPTLTTPSTIYMLTTPETALKRHVPCGDLSATLPYGPGCTPNYFSPNFMRINRLGCSGAVNNQTFGDPTGGGGTSETICMTTLLRHDGLFTNEGIHTQRQLEIEVDSVIVPNLISDSVNTLRFSFQYPGMAISGARMWVFGPSHALGDNPGPTGILAAGTELLSSVVNWPTTSSAKLYPKNISATAISYDSILDRYTTEFNITTPNFGTQPMGIYDLYFVLYDNQDQYVATYIIKSELTRKEDPPEPCSITDIILGAQTPCDPETNTYTQTLSIVYSNEPTTGQLSVNGQLFPITSSPQEVTLTGLPSDGNFVTVSAFFTDDQGCSFTVQGLFAAPDDCTPPDPTPCPYTIEGSMAVYDKEYDCNVLRLSPLQRVRSTIFLDKAAYNECEFGDFDSDLSSIQVSLLDSTMTPLVTYTGNFGIGFSSSNINLTGTLEPTGATLSATYQVADPLAGNNAYIRWTVGSSAGGGSTTVFTQILEVDGYQQDLSSQELIETNFYTASGTLAVEPFKYCEEDECIFVETIRDATTENFKQIAVWLKPNGDIVEAEEWVGVLPQLSSPEQSDIEVSFLSEGTDLDVLHKFCGPMEGCVGMVGFREQVELNYYVYAAHFINHEGADDREYDRLVIPPQPFSYTYKEVSISNNVADTSDSTDGFRFSINPLGSDNPNHPAFGPEMDMTTFLTYDVPAGASVRVKRGKFLSPSYTDMTMSLKIGSAAAVIPPTFNVEIPVVGMTYVNNVLIDLMGPVDLINAGSTYAGVRSFALREFVDIQNYNLGLFPYDDQGAPNPTVADFINDFNGSGKLLHMNFATEFSWSLPPSNNQNHTLFVEGSYPSGDTTLKGVYNPGRFDYSPFRQNILALDNTPFNNRRNRLELNSPHIFNDFKWQDMAIGEKRFFAFTVENNVTLFKAVFYVGWQNNAQIQPPLPQGSANAHFVVRTDGNRPEILLLSGGATGQAVSQVLARPVNVDLQAGQQRSQNIVIGFEKTGNYQTTSYIYFNGRYTSAVHNFATNTNYEVREFPGNPVEAWVGIAGPTGKNTLDNKRWPRRTHDLYVFRRMLTEEECRKYVTGFGESSFDTPAPYFWRFEDNYDVGTDTFVITQGPEGALAGDPKIYAPRTTPITTDYFYI